MPFLTGFFQRLQHFHGTFLARATEGKLHGHHGQTQNKQKQDIKQHEETAAGRCDHRREFPHVSKADCTARRQQNEAQTAAQFFSFHINPSKVIHIQFILPLYREKGKQNLFCFKCEKHPRKLALEMRVKKWYIGQKGYRYPKPNSREGSRSSRLHLRGRWHGGSRDGGSENRCP